MENILKKKFVVKEIDVNISKSLVKIKTNEYVSPPEIISSSSSTLIPTDLQELIKNKAKMGKISYAMLSGSFVRGKPYAQNEVDLFVVGTIVLPELSQIIKEEEARRNREINFTPMTDEEFNFRKNRRDPFVLSILSKPRVMLIGDEEEMVKL